MENLDRAVARVLGGDASAFRDVVEATSGPLVRLAARIMASVADGEDVVQEAYVKAYWALLEGRFDARAGFAPWLRRIVVNTAVDALRARARAPRPSEESAELRADSAASAETALALAELGDWLSELPAEQRVALILKAIEGYSSREIAEIMGSSEGAVEQRLVRARAALRERSERE